MSPAWVRRGLGRDAGRGAPRPCTSSIDQAAIRAILYREVGRPSRFMLDDESTHSDDSCPADQSPCYHSSSALLEVDQIDGGRTIGYEDQYDFLSPAWDPDGSRFAYHTLQNLGTAAPDGNGFRVHVAELDGCGSGCLEDIRLEFDPASDDEGWPVWSPDGSRLALQTFEGGAARMVIMSAPDLTAASDAKRGRNCHLCRRQAQARWAMHGLPTGQGSCSLIRGHPNRPPTTSTHPPES